LAKSYLNILRKQNISHFAKRNISHAIGVFHPTKSDFTENGNAVFHTDILYKIIIYYKKYIAIFNNICYNIPCIII
jgi:hypothetical protein